MEELEIGRLKGMTRFAKHLGEAGALRMSYASVGGGKIASTCASAARGRTCDPI